MMNFFWIDFDSLNDQNLLLVMQGDSEWWRMFPYTRDYSSAATAVLTHCVVSFSH